MFLIKSLIKNGPLLIITAASLWAFDGVIRRSLYVLPPITIVFFEHLIGSLILIPFVYKQLSKISFTRKEWMLLIWVSLFSSLLGTLWFTTALLKVNFIPFSVVFLIQKLQPVFALLSARLFLGENLEKRYFLWAVLALLAAYFVTFKDGVVNLQTGNGTMEAALFALGAAFAWGSSTTFSKMVLKNKPDTVVTALRFIITTFLAIPVLILLGAGSSLSLVGGSELLKFVFIALSTGMIALLIYYKGLKLTPVRVSTILELTFPFLAIIIDVVLYKTFLSLSQLAAAVILIFSIYQISNLQKKNEI